MLAPVTFLEPEHPSWLLDLRDAVAEAFVVTGADTPGWADPYPDRDGPDSTYSTCADPGKYRILETRLDAWAQVLTERELASVREVAPADLDQVATTRGTTAISRVRRLDPLHPEGLSLVAGSTLVAGAPFGLDLGLVGSTPTTGVVFVEILPDCGCDHCDSGSEDLLAVLDEWVMTVARGGVLHVRHDADTMTRTWDGWQGTGMHPDTWLDDPVSAPAGSLVWRGEPWSLRPRSAP